MIRSYLNLTIGLCKKSHILIMVDFEPYAVNRKSNKVLYINGKIGNFGKEEKN